MYMNRFGESQALLKGERRVDSGRPGALAFGASLALLLPSLGLATCSCLVRLRRGSYSRLLSLLVRHCPSTVPIQPLAAPQTPAVSHRSTLMDFIVVWLTRIPQRG